MNVYPILPAVIGIIYLIVTARLTIRDYRNSSGTTPQERRDEAMDYAGLSFAIATFSTFGLTFLVALIMHAGGDYPGNPDRTETQQATVEWLLTAAIAISAAWGVWAQRTASRLGIRLSIGTPPTGE